MRYIQPKYVIGDVVIVKDYKDRCEFFAQMKISDARLLTNRDQWEYRSVLGKDKSDWYGESVIIGKVM